VDERRHNTDGALFVDEDEGAGSAKRPARADEARRGPRAGEARRPERAGDARGGTERSGEPRRAERANEPADAERAGQPRFAERASELRESGRGDEPSDLDEPDDLDDDEGDLDDDEGDLEDDEKADDARRVTQAILDRMDLDARVTIREDDERVVLDIDGPDAGRAIGKKGMTLEALQFLVNKIVNREPDERRHIVLDSGDYRERHDSGLVAMAKREAKRAVSSGRSVTLEPMSARDRRVIHVSLAKFPGVSTRSEGEGTDRRLQIIPARGGAGGRERDERPRERPRGPGREGRGRGGAYGRPGPAAQGHSSAADRPAQARDAELEPAPRERDLDDPEGAAGERGYDDRERGYDRGD
jgi:spoIIIJ-associated protein